LHDGITTLVFDLDGTLVETAADLHLVLEEVMAEEGLAAPPLAAVRGMIGDGAKVLIERALAAIGQPQDPALVERLFARFRARYAQEPCRASEPYPGARELLAELQERGMRMGLCTNKPQAATTGLLQALGMAGFFASAVGGDTLPVRKPDPGHLAAVLADLGVRPEAAVMVGDSRNDLLTARGLGVPCILVSFGYTTVPARELEPDAVIDHLADLPRALAGLRGGA
jgi:phosphoglycolate phosphatase